MLYRKIQKFKYKKGDCNYQKTLYGITVILLYYNCTSLSLKTIITIPLQGVTHMSKQTIIIDNSLHQPQKFDIEEHDEYIVLLCFLNDEASKSVSQIDIPATINGKPVTVIGKNCFFNCKSIEKVNLPDTITTIGIQAFALCESVQELFLPDSVTEIEMYAFRDCRSLKKVIMPTHLKILRHGLFSFCYLCHNAEIILPPELETIEGGVFWCGGNFDLIIPDTVKEIGVGAFNWGPRPITKLPLDDGWFSKWPYGETVKCDRFDSIGKITSIKPLENNCELHEVNFDGKKELFFSPCDYADGLISFVDEKNQASMIRDIDERRKADAESSQGDNKLSYAYTIRDYWKRGIVDVRE